MANDLTAVANEIEPVKLGVLDTDNLETSETSGDYKYAQLVLPDFELDATESASGSGTTASSFVRLGSFPSLSDTSTATLDGIADGLANSYALAKLVADTGRFASHDGTTTTTYDNAVDTATTETYGVISDADYKGDKNFLVGFVDDTRQRYAESDGEEISIDGSPTTNTTSARKTETKRLLTKGGWWEHTDGNRITTTAGDKLEVIGGNYKMVILGRQDPTATTLDMNKVKVIDVSGGRDCSITGGLDFGKLQEYLTDEGVWATYAYDCPKRAYKESHGVDVSVFLGTEKVSITGEEPEGAGVRLAKTKVGDPKVITKQWATNVESYTGSASKPIPRAYSFTSGLAKEEISFGVTTVSVKSTVLTTSVTATGLNIETKLHLKNIACAISGIFVGGTVLRDSFEYKTGMVYKAFFSKPEVILEEKEITVAKEHLAGAKASICRKIARIVGSRIGVAAVQKTELSSMVSEIVGIKRTKTGLLMI